GTPDLDATGHLACAIDARIHGVDRKGAGDEKLGRSAKQQERKISRPQLARERLGNAKRRHERRNLRGLAQVSLDAPLLREKSHAVESVAQREQVEIAQRGGMAGPPVPCLQRALANEEVPEQAAACFDRGSAHAHEVLGTVLIAPESVRGPGRRLHEDEDPPRAVLSLDLLQQRCERRRDTIPAAGQRRVLDLFEPPGRQPSAHELRESMLVLRFTRSAYYVAAAPVLQIIREGTECRN